VTRLKTVDIRNIADDISQVHHIQMGFSCPLVLGRDAESIVKTDNVVPIRHRRYADGVI
jgi:hypothetical protein